MKPNCNLALLLWSVCLFFSAPSFADTFIVTSNADTGPGSFREAISLSVANGTTLTDYIHFNIADQTEAGRTISLQSILPVISSETVIDGTTQSGSNFSISNAKILLYVDHFIQDDFQYLFIEHAHDVKILGIYFKAIDAYQRKVAIGITDCFNLVIGEQGKGNYFTNVSSISNSYADTVHHITIQGNVFGTRYTLGGNITLYECRDVLIGGNLPGQRNIFIEATCNLWQYTGTAPGSFVTIENNWVGYDGQDYLYSDGHFELHGSVNDNNPETVKTIIKNNLTTIGYSDWDWVIALLNIKHKVLVQGNKLGIALDGTSCPGYDNNILAFDCANTIIGGYAAAEKNTLDHITTLSKGVHLIKNDVRGKLVTLDDTVSFIKILRYDNGLIEGTATPNAKIQLYTSECGDYCVFKRYFATVFSDANGNWSFPYTAAMPPIVATATYDDFRSLLLHDSATSAFSEPKFDYSSLQVIHATCGKSNGSILGLNIYEGTHFGWYNSANQLISTDTNLINVPAGYYTFKISNGPTTCPASTVVEIINREPYIQNVDTYDATCGQDNGIIIADLYSQGSRWMNAAMDSIGTGYFMNHLLPGEYWLKVWIIPDTTCSKLYGPFIINNLSGATLNMNNVVRIPPTCGNNNAGITGITALNVTGTPFIAWVDSLNNIVGNSFDVHDLPAGKYRLKFKDEATCDTIFTPYYILADISVIIININTATIIGSTCGAVNGSIEQITVTGAASYTWLNAAGQVIGSSLSLHNVPEGMYVLVASNNYNCEKKTDSIFVPSKPFVPANTAIFFDLSSGTCDLPNGHYTLLNFPDPQLYSFRWVDSLYPNQVISTSMNLAGINHGSFYLFAKNATGCEQKILTARLPYLSPVRIDESAVRITPEICGSKKGMIEGIQPLAGTGTAPYTYQWLDAAGQDVVASRQLLNSAAGSYRCIITDNNGCTDTGNLFTINNQLVSLNDPLYADQSVRRQTTATLILQNPHQGIYYLYDHATATVPLTQNSNGVFTTATLDNDKIYFIELISGQCKSRRVPVKITVYDKTSIYVPSAFTPNTDGSNDLMKPVTYGPVKLEYFKIYNRWGQLVYSGTGNLKGWNGMWNGFLQPAAGYVWILKALDEMSREVINMQGSFLLLR
jgi:gliding motility-associated-like protein